MSPLDVSYTGCSLENLILFGSPAPPSRPLVKLRSGSALELLQRAERARSHYAKRTSRTRLWWKRKRCALSPLALVASSVRFDLPRGEQQRKEKARAKWKEIDEFQLETVYTL